VSGPAVVTATEVRIAAGAGTLIRRSTAILFVDGTDAAIVDAFVGSADAGPADAVIEAVTDALTAGEFRAPPFVLVAWDEQLHLVVFGAIEVRTDHPSLAMLSGAGSASWVERRLRSIGVATIEAGAAADPASDLQLGRVAANGFAATFEPSAAAASVPAAPEATPSRSTTSPATAAPVPATPPTPSPAADPTGPIAGDRLAALRAAMRARDVEPPTVAEAAGYDASLEEPIDDEVTLAPFDPAPLAEATTAEPDSPTLDTPTPGTPTPGTPTPDAGADDAAPFVLAVRCGRGHVNPIHVTVCQTCGDLLEIGAPTETIRQPPLAMLELPSGETIAIDRSLVLGRRPDPDAAQAQDRAFTVVVGDEPSISRTHLRIDVEDWSLSVTDCGSRSGTAIVIRPGEEPRILEPWMTHELPVGARLFLGGPTSVVVRPIPARRSTSGG